MASVEKIDNAIDRLLFLKGLAMQSEFYLVDGWSVEEAFKEVSEALHSVEAEKERLVELAREMFSADSACGCGFYDDDRWRSAYFGLQVAVGSPESTCVFDPGTDEFPAPPEHKPE